MTSCAETTPPATLKAAVVADDLTGAADTGIQFRAVADPFLLMAGDTSAENIPKTAAGLALFTNSRHDPPPIAGEKTRRAADLLRPLNPALIYKKIDSCLRGNVGAVIDALADALDCRVSFIAPALPAQGRTTVDDVHQVHGVPVAESEMAADPRCPVTESRLSRLIAAQSRMPVDHISITDVAAGAEPLEQVVRDRMNSGTRHIAFDAADTDHLDAIAAVADRIPEKILLIGSAGLAGSVAARHHPESARTSIGHLGRMLWVCGSASATSAKQVDALRHGANVAPQMLSASRLAAGDACRDIIERAVSGWRSGVRLLRIEPNGDETLQDPQAVVSGLATVAAAIVREASPDGIFLTGGDTAEAVWQALGAAAIRLDGELLPGVIQGTWIGGAMDGRTVVTKAGAFGEAETLLNLHRIISDIKRTPND